MEVFVETERLILREIIPGDVEGMFELDSDKEVHKYLGNKPVTSIEESRKTIEFVRQQYIENGIGRSAIIEKATNSFVGWTGLKLVKETVNKHTNFYDLGYRLIRKYWGKGYATESALASVKYGFQTINLSEIIGMADIRNFASQNVLEKSGLKFIETFDREGVLHNWFSILREE